jgi:hypothetical protein
MVWVALGTASAAERVGVDLSERPDVVGLRAFDVAVIRAEAQVDLEQLHAAGVKLLAAVDVREVAAGSAAEEEARVLGVPLTTADGGMIRLDVRHEGWLTVAVRALLRPAAERGFNGYVLMGLGALTEDERTAAAQGIAALHAMFPEKHLVLRDAPELTRECAHHVRGVLLTGHEVAEPRLREAVKLGLSAYVAEYAEESTVAHLEERARAIGAAGGAPFLTTAALDGRNLGPLRLVQRRVVVLHSGPVRETLTWKVLHGTLQWLGHEVVYEEMKSGMTVAPGTAAVIVDASLKLPDVLQAELTALIKRLAQQKVRLLLTGLPWESLEGLAEVGSALGWQGSGARIQPVRKAAFGKLEMGALMRTGAVAPRTQDFRDLRAPSGARVLVSIRSAPTRMSFDAVYVAEWGGVWLDSLAAVAGPQVAPLCFLNLLLGGAAAAPVPDVASLEGKRLMVTHVGSEGFTRLSNAKGLPLAAEVMRERVVKRYPLPFTVALCEGDVRGWTPESERRDALRYSQAARALLALPNVEAASGSLSRPNKWDGKNFEAGPLDAHGAEVRLGLEREIGGSLAFIHRQLLPFGRSVPMMLWPRKTAAGAEAVAFARRMGVESLEYLAAELFPGGAVPMRPFFFGSVLAPETRPGGRLEAAAMQAEIERSGEGAWEHAVQVALSFEDVVTEQSLREVEALLGWCQTQPLHALPASSYAKLVRDAVRTRVYEAGPGHWVILNEGLARTLRLPEAMGTPDLSASHGITGYTARGGYLYIHTAGGKKTELVLEKAMKKGELRMVSVTGEVKVVDAESGRQVFRVKGAEPVRVSMTGLRAGQVCEMRAGRAVTYHTADAGGGFEFEAPAGALVQLQALPSRHAALR